MGLRRLLKKAFKKPVQAKDPILCFKENGCKPWTEGYDEYKWRFITNAIERNTFCDAIGTERYGFRIDERAVEYPWLFSKLPDGSGLMLDAGSALNFRTLLMHDKIRSKRLVIATLAPESQACHDLGVSYLYEDLRESVLRDNCFDYISCLSTMEHVGMDNAMLYTNDAAKKENDERSWLFFLDALRARLKAGGKLFLTMPFGRRKNHGWFQVFDATMVDLLLERFAPAAYSEDVFFYTDDRWNRVDRETAKDAACFDIHVQKEYEADFLAFSRSVVCLALQKKQ